uniref:Uncharacterized protein n=1 Tax=Ditylenchus dipsaci TaxID=166011 RepID=A0A915E2X6_9BILA
MQLQVEQPKKRGAAREWIKECKKIFRYFEKECKSKEDTDQWMDENNGLWIHDCKRSTVKFADIVYYCDHSGRNRPGNFNCTAAMRMRYAKDLTATSMAFIQTSGEHDHDRLKDTNLSSPVKISIKNKEDCKSNSTET